MPFKLEVDGGTNALLETMKGLVVVVEGVMGVERATGGLEIGVVQDGIEGAMEGRTEGAVDGVRGVMDPPKEVKQFVTIVEEAVVLTTEGAILLTILPMPLELFMRDETVSLFTHDC
jgi:hypothetical protein